MKTTLLILTLAGICAASTVTNTSAPPCSSASSILGAEDWARPASDLDFNDLTYWVCGLSYGYGPEFDFIPPSGYSEQPFPQPACYANFGVALDNEVSFAFRSSQTSGHDSAWIAQNAQPWQFVGSGITLETAPGDRIDFAILADGNPLLADPARNADKLGYFVAYPLEIVPTVSAATPESGTFGLAIVAALFCFACAIFVKAWRRLSSMPVRRGIRSPACCR
jgi:hypothetical protein